MSVAGPCQEVTRVPLFQILALFHLSLGQQLNLFWLHKVLHLSPVLLLTHIRVWSDLNLRLW